MRHVPGMVAVLGLALLVLPAEPCGDKFIVLGRGIGKVPRAPRPGSVLLVVPAGTAAEAASRELRLEAVLKRAGHRTVLVRSLDEMSTALRGHRFDVVVAAAEAAGPAREALRSVPETTVLPLLHKPGSEARAAEAAFVATPDRKLDYLKVIDAAIARAQPAVAQR
jgi:hypothetical protein